MASQALMGGIRARQICVRDYVRAGPNPVVLDIGCGPGYTLTLFEYPEYYGFDISKSYISHARKTYAGRGHFFCQYFDAAVLDWLPKADIVLLMGLLHHLDDNEASQLLTLARAAMKPSARLYTLDGCFREAQSPIARYFLRKDRGAFVRDQTGYARLAGNVFRVVNCTIREDLFRIPYTTLIMECAL
jgi:SAM-dependent methyltransferase